MTGPINANQPIQSTQPIKELESVEEQKRVELSKELIDVIPETELEIAIDGDLTLENADAAEDEIPTEFSTKEDLLAFVDADGDGKISDEEMLKAKDKFENAGIKKITIDGKEFNMIYAHGERKTKGTNGNDIIWGTEGKDKIKGKKGDDIIFGAGGNDKIRGGRGKDLIIRGTHRKKSFFEKIGYGLLLSGIPGMETIVPSLFGIATTTAAGAVATAGTTAAGAVATVGTTAAGAVATVGTTAAGAVATAGTTAAGIAIPASEILLKESLEELEDSEVEEIETEESEELEKTEE